MPVNVDNRSNTPRPIFSSDGRGNQSVSQIEYQGRRYSVAEFRTAHGDIYDQMVQSALASRPTGSTADGLANQLLAGINDANAASERGRKQSLRGIRTDIRKTRGSYDDIFAGLDSEKAGIETGYQSARNSLLGSHEPAIASIERGRKTSDAAAHVGLTDRGLFNTTLKQTVEQGNRETADRDKSDVYADYGSRLAGLETQRTADIAGIDERRAGARADLGGVVRGLRQEKRGILERTVRETPSYSDYLSLLTGQATASGSRRAAQTANYQALLSGLATLGGAAASRIRTGQ